MAAALVIWIYGAFSAYRTYMRMEDSLNWTMIGLLFLSGGYVFYTALYFRKKELAESANPANQEPKE